MDSRFINHNQMNNHSPTHPSSHTYGDPAAAVSCPSPSPIRTNPRTSRPVALPPRLPSSPVDIIREAVDEVRSDPIEAPEGPWYNDHPIEVAPAAASDVSGGLREELRTPYSASFRRTRAGHWEKSQTTPSAQHPPVIAAPEVCRCQHSVTEMTAATTGDTSKRDLHVYHRHGDVQLRANDGTIFHIDGWRLANASAHFQKQIRTSSGDWISTISTIVGVVSKSESCPIELKVNAALGDLFANLISVSHTSDFSLTTTFAETTALLELCERFECKPDIIDTIISRLHALAARQPWALLAFASERDDVPLGKVALGKMNPKTFLEGGEDDKHQGREEFWMRLASLSGPWAAGLLAVSLRAEGLSKNSNYVTPFDISFTLESWSDVSKDFTPLDSASSLRMYSNIQ